MRDAINCSEISYTPRAQIPSAVYICIFCFADGVLRSSSAAGEFVAALRYSPGKRLAKTIELPFRFFFEGKRSEKNIRLPSLTIAQIVVPHQSSTSAATRTRPPTLGLL